MELPNELLINIFNKLDISSLIEVSETCKRFYYVVTSNSKLNDRFCLKISYSPESWNSEDATKVDVSQVNAIVESGRKFSKLCINGLSTEQDREHFLKLINADGFKEKIVKVAFKGCKILNSFQHRVFSNMPKIDSIVMISQQDEIQQDICTDSLPSFKKLKVLVTNNGSFFLKSENLHDLLLSSTTPQDLIWICKQKNLVKLQIYMKQNSSLEEFQTQIKNITEIPLQLKFLTIVANPADRTMIGSLSRLYTSQSQLQVLQLLGRFQSTQEQIKEILQLKSLTSLLFPFQNVHPNIEILEKSYGNMKNLEIGFLEPNLDIIVKFVNLFPNLENLTLMLESLPSEDYNEMIQFDHLKRLKHVTCQLHQNGISGVFLKVKQLTKLIVTMSSFSPQDWNTIVSNNPNIQILQIVACPLELKHVQVIVDGLPKLTHVECYLYILQYAWDKESFKYLLENAKSLKKVKLAVKGAKEDYAELLEKHSELTKNSFIEFQ